MDLIGNVGVVTVDILVNSERVNKHKEFAISKY